MTRVMNGDGRFSGPVHHLPSVAPPNRADDHAIVTEACGALEAFGTDLDRTTVRKLLPMWKHFTEMAPEDMTAVLRRFPGKGE